MEKKPKRERPRNNLFRHSWQSWHELMGVKELRQLVFKPCHGAYWPGVRGCFRFKVQVHSKSRLRMRASSEFAMM